MLRVTVELLQHGDENKKSLLGVLDIANTGTGTPTSGTYSVRASRRGSADTKGRPWRAAVVKDFPRQRLGVWDLLMTCLISLCAERVNGKGVSIRPVQMEEGLE